MLHVCVLQMKDGRWHQTHFVFHSLDPALLPVVDIFNLPTAPPGSHYHLEVGPVCFLWGLSPEHLTVAECIISLRWLALCGRGGGSALPLNPCRREREKKIQSDQTSERVRAFHPEKKGNLPLDCRHRGRESRELGRGRAEEEPKSSCTNSFLYGYRWFRLFKDDPSASTRLERKTKKKAFLRQTISLEHYKVKGDPGRVSQRTLE